MDEKTLTNIRKRVAHCSSEQAVIAPWGDIIATDQPEEIERIRRVNLLIRNKMFLAEWLKLRPLMEKRAKRMAQPWKNRSWQDFCFRWQIQGFWEGDMQSLSSYASGGAEFFFKDQAGRIASVPFTSVMVRGGKHIIPCGPTRWPHGIHKEPTFIYLKITPQTGLKDVERMWPVVEVLKADIWKVSERRKRTFSRDLTLFDLHSNRIYGPLTYGQIARRQKMDKAKVQLACKRISESIRRIAHPTF